VLTDKAVKAIKIPEGKRFQKVSDGRGLYLYCTPEGLRSWRYDYRLNGKRPTITLGTYPDTSLAEARERHTEARKLVKSGTDPLLARQREKQAALISTGNTVKAVAEDWFAETVKHRSQAWAIGVRSRLDKYVFPNLGHRPIQDVEPLDLLTLEKDIARTLPKTAQRVHDLLTRVWAYGVRNLRVKGNPLRDLRGAFMVPAVKHHKPMAEAEIPRYLTTVEGYSGRAETKLACKLLLLTMTRKSELIRARWLEFDFDTRTWIIPGERMKGRLPHIVPLADEVLAAFQLLKSIAGASEYVFPHFANPQKTMSSATLNEAFTRMKLDICPHGLRGTASTILNESGLFRPDAIERQLAHVEKNAVRAAYNSAQYLEERRKLMQWWATFCLTPPESNVVALKRRA
jgi:integrase